MPICGKLLIAGIDSFAMVIFFQSKNKIFLMLNYHLRIHFVFLEKRIHFGHAEKPLLTRRAPRPCLLKRGRLPPQPATFHRKPLRLELGPLSVRRNLARHGKLLFRALRIAPFGPLLANDSLGRSRSGTEEGPNRPVFTHCPGLLRCFRGNHRGGIPRSMRHGKRPREDFCRVRVPFMDPSLHVFSRRFQRAALVHRFRHDRRIVGRCNNGNARQAETEMGGTGSRGCGGNPPSRAFRIHENPLPSGARPNGGMVPHLQPLSLLTPLPSRNGRVRRRDSDGKRGRSPLALVRLRLSRFIFLSVRLSLAHPRSPRFRLFMAERPLPVPFGSAPPRHGTRYRSLYQKGWEMAR